MDEQKTAVSRDARHLAARAVMADRASFPIQHVALSSSNERETGIAYDWKQVRSTGVNDDTLIQQHLRLEAVSSDPLEAVVKW